MKIEVKKPTEEELRRAKSWPIWEKEPSTFPWEYDQKETCLILEGRSIVKTDEGSVEFGLVILLSFQRISSVLGKLRIRLENITN